MRGRSGRKWHWSIVDNVAFFIEDHVSGASLGGSGNGGRGAAMGSGGHARRGILDSCDGGGALCNRRALGGSTGLESSRVFGIDNAAVDIVTLAEFGQDAIENVDIVRVEGELRDHAAKAVQEVALPRRSPARVERGAFFPPPHVFETHRLHARPGV